MGSNAQDNCEVVCDPHDLARYFCSRQANSLSCVSKPCPMYLQHFRRAEPLPFCCLISNNQQVLAMENLELLARSLLAEERHNVALALRSWFLGLCRL